MALCTAIAALAGSTAGVLADPGDTSAPLIPIKVDDIPESRSIMVPPTAGVPSVFLPRGSVTLYQRITENANRFNPGLGGNPAGSGTRPDVTFDDVPITAANLQVSGVLVSSVNICQVKVGIRQLNGSPAQDVNVFFATLRSNTTAPDTAIDTPPTLITDTTSPLSTTPPLGSAGGTRVSATLTANNTGASRTSVITLGDGVNPLPGMSNLPLNMAYIAGGAPATFGSFAVGVQMGDTTSGLTGWRVTDGAGANANIFWVYDVDLPSPETGPFAFNPTTIPSAFYIEVHGVPVAPTTPQPCCLANANGSPVCVVMNGAANCTQAAGTIVSTCSGATPCSTIVCCNNTTGVCTVLAGQTTCPGSQVIQTGSTTCTGITCSQLPAPGNDDCAAASVGSLFELSLPAHPSRTNQTLVSATPSMAASTCAFPTNDVWYLVSLTAAQSAQQFQISVTPQATSGDFTQQPVSIAVYDGAGGCPAAPGGELGCVDIANPNSVQFTGSGSQAYFVRVSGFAPVTTKFDITLAQVVSGACCNPTNGLCVVSNNVGVCTTAGYTDYQGNQTVCTPNPCTLGACCQPNSIVCTLTGASGCTGGAFQGTGSTCAVNPCGGACCNTVTGVCNLTTSANCTGAGTTFAGNGQGCGVCPAPANDACFSASTLLLNVQQTGVILGATGADLASCSGTTIDTWYAFTPATTGNFKITVTPGSATSQGKAVTTFNPPCDPVADTDNFCAGAPAAGAATILYASMTSGQQQLIRVGGFAGDTGSFTIIVQTPETTSGACCLIGSQCVVVATSADCAAPSVFQGAGATCGATTCPAGACCFPGSPQCFVTTLSFCNGVTGTWNAGDQTCTATNCTGLTPGNDACTSAFTITSPTFTSNVGSEFAINEGLPAGTCNSAASQTTGANNSIWYTFTATQTGVLNIQLNNWGTYDMILQAFSGSCANLTPLGCLDDPEPYNANLNVTAGTTYFLMIAQFDTAAVNGGWNSLTTTFALSGACCVSGACTAGVTQAACTGTWQGANSTCTPDPCAAGGICCRGSTCTTTITTSAACTGSLIGGQLAGATFSAGSTCNAGAISTSPCCYANYNKANGISVQDIFDFLGDWFAGSPYANVGGSGAPGPLSVQNIFDFLTDWFNGGCN